MLKRFTKLEKSWILYDIGNSAFTMMVSTIIPIWYNTLAGYAGVNQAGYLRDNCYGCTRSDYRCPG